MNGEQWREMAWNGEGIIGNSRELLTPRATSDITGKILIIALRRSYRILDN